MQPEASPCLVLKFKQCVRVTMGLIRKALVQCASLPKVLVLPPECSRHRESGL